MRLLLVDDEPGILKVLGISLTDRGYEVLTAESGEKALEIFRRGLPSIVLTDIKMPGMDGIQLLLKIKEECPDTEVIMITGHGDMELAIQSLKHDASDFITKPIHDDALEIALKRAREKISTKGKLREYTQELERLVREKTQKLLDVERLAAVGQTVAGLAHAIKSITSGLTGGMFVLQKGIELDNRDYLGQGWQMVKGNVDKIKAMAMDLLSLSKEREPEYRHCDPNQPAREVHNLVAPKARESGVSLRLELSEGLPEAWFDPEGVHRVLLDLVGNAVDACIDVSRDDRQGDVVLRTTRPSGWSVEYRVEDNGCGMDEDTKKKIFHLFFSTKGSKGTGLGLMIAKKIVQEHGGEMDFSSEKGEGTIFSFRLPEKKP